MSYQLLTCGHEKKWEQFGEYVLERPAPVALWTPQEIPKVDASFSRIDKKGWEGKLPASWVVEFFGIKLKLEATDFGHIGLFPEHQQHWDWIKEQAQKSNKPNVLNLFAHSGSTTVFLAKEGIEVCHLDAVSPVVTWARENAALNGLEKAPVRWIVDDAIKFLLREKRRGKVYDGIIIDPPTFGRGKQGQVFKIEKDIIKLLELCRDLLRERNSFFLFTCHTPGFSQTVMHHLVDEVFKKGNLETGEMLLQAKFGPTLPSGVYARWSQSG